MKLASKSESDIKYVDEKWFKLFVGIRRPLLLNSFSYVIKAMELEKKLFLSSNNYTPKFIYRINNLNTLATEATVTLLELRSQLLLQESNLSIRDTYIDKIDEAILEQNIILASHDSNWESFNKLNYERFGQISAESISVRVHNIKNKFNLLSDVVLTESKKKGLIDENDLSEATLYFESWPNLCINYSNNDQRVLDSSEVVDIWNDSLSKIGTQWRAMLSDEVIHIKVNNKLEKIFIPQGVKFPFEKVRSLYAHEVGVHVFRRENGKKSRLKLLSIGLAGYDSAEEGICLMREQVILKRSKLPSFDKYFALAYAVGVVDGEAKNFRSVYNMLKEIFTNRLATRFQMDDVKRIAEDRAWNVTMRAFRGGNPAIPGCCFYRDKIYREGNIKMWDLFINSPDKFSYAKYGKFDPSNDKHMNLVLEYAT